MMKNAFLTLLLLGVTLGAAEIPVATPGTDPSFPETAPIWIKADSPLKSNFGKEKVSDSFSGTILRKLAKEPETGEFSAEYEFNVRKEGDYTFFAALVTQKRPHASPVEFRFDENPWKEVPNNAGSPAWGVSRAISWNPLETVTLTEGKHKLAFRITKRAQLGSWSFMFDGAIGFELSAWKEARITAPTTQTLTILPGEKPTLRYTQSGSPFFAELRLVFADRPMITQHFFSKSGENIVELTLPDRLGAGEYKIELSPADDRSHVFFTLPATIPAAAVERPARLAKAEWNRGEYRLSFENDKSSPVLAMFFFDRKLFHTAVLEQAAGKLPAELQAQLAGRKWSVRIQSLPADKGNFIENDIEFPGTAQPLPKPVNYGFFTDRNDIVHAWFMNRDYEYIFDGKRYFPTGGMWCSDSLISKDAGVGRINANLAKDLKTIRGIKAEGLDDVYLNLSTQASLGVRQAFIDMLEEEGVFYGYQLNGGGGSNIPSFFITIDRENAAGNYRGLTRAVYADGKVTARFPKEQKLQGVLLFNPKTPKEKVQFFDFLDREGKDSRHGIIDLDKAQDFGKLREIAFRAELKLPENSEVILIPLLESNMHHANLWDEAEYQKSLSNISWIGQMNWNKNLRFFVDPVKNETHMVNSTENLRQYTPAINAAFAAYLEKRYGSLAELRKNWALPVASFDQASRLIPLRQTEAVLWIDPQEGTVLSSNLTDSFAWIDYQEMIRISYSELIDRLVSDMKKMVDIPVICKSVGVIGEKMNLSTRYLGLDGIGYETYLNQGVPGETGGGASRAEAEASTHTMWKIGTEVGHSAAVQNDGTKFFTDEEEIRNMAADLSRLGVRGFYFFGFDLKPGHLWSNHNYHDFPEGLKWAARIDREYNASPIPATPANYVFPGGFTWWWWTSRYKAFYGYEQNLIPQSARLGKNSNEYFSSSNTLPENFDAVLINCPYPPFSRYYAADIARAITSGKKVYYIGERTDLGAIPELDRFFTPERIEFADNSHAQVLKPGKDDKVLASENGKPWAIRHNNLIVVSRTPQELPTNNSDEFLKYLSELL